MGLCPRVPWFPSVFAGAAALAGLSLAQPRCNSCFVLGGLLWACLPPPPAQSPPLQAIAARSTLGPVGPLP